MQKLIQNLKGMRNGFILSLRIKRQLDGNKCSMADGPTNGQVFGVWKERNLARHGETEQEQAEKKKERCLAELKMWHDHRNEGRLSLAETAEEEIFHDAVEEHQEKEGTMARIRGWLCTFGSVLLQSELLAVAAKRRAARNGN